MRIPPFLLAALGAFALAAALPASANDDTDAKGRVVVFGSGVAKFRVAHERDAGKVIVRLDDSNVKLSESPVLVLRSKDGTRDVVFTALEGETNAWVASDASLENADLDGTMKIVVDGKTYSSVLTSASTEASGDASGWASGETLVVGTTKFDVVPDRDAGKLTLRLADRSVRLASPPTLMLRTATGTREVTLASVPGDEYAWVVTDPSLVGSDAFDGTMKIVVDGKPYSAPLVLRTRVSPLAARHGGRVVTFPSCAAHVEAVWDPPTGTLTIHALGDVRLLEAPEFTVNEMQGPRKLVVTKVDGEPGAWRVTNEALRVRTLTGRIKVLVDGKPCETSLVMSGRGGTVVNVANGPRFEVVRGDRGEVTFYALDETVDGRPYTIENPEVIVTTSEGPRTVRLAPVPEEPRAWRLIGFEAQPREPFDARFRFTLFGKSLETDVGISGVGVGIR